MTTAHTTEERRPAESTRVRILIVATPLAIGAIGVVLVALMKNSLPDPVATHWNYNGQADGFTSRDSAIWLPAIGGVIGAFVAVFAWRFIGRATSIARMSIGTAVGLAGFTSAASVFTLWAQSGLADASKAPLLWWELPAAAVVGVAVGWLSSRIVPADADYLVDRGQVPADAERLDIKPGEQAAWAGWSQPGIASFIVIVVALGVLAWALSSGDIARLPLGAALLLIPIAALLVATLFVRVTVGRNGLMVRSAFGFRLVRVPLDQVHEATVTEVRPLRQFGGWGPRLGLSGNKVGVITRGGSALEVERGDGSRVVVTIPRPHQPVALLNTLADQARTT